MIWADTLMDKLNDKQRSIAERIVKEIKERLKFLVNVGLDYLQLSRESATLSGGEGQRIRLASQIGSGLTGVLYVLDEPSIGLHQRDNTRLIATLKNLRDLGNTVLIVEHDDETILHADYVIDIGPGAGVHGGHIMAQGTVEEIMTDPNSITGLYLSGKKSIAIPSTRRPGHPEKSIELIGATANNLQNVDIKIPLGTFSVVTGVSGGGKSSLIIHTLYKAAIKYLEPYSKVTPGPFKQIKGLEYIDKIIDIDQSPIGRTPRSNPATYTGLFNYIRDWFAELPESKARGYKISRFSFNIKGGRCEACQGDGLIKIEMHFLPDVYVKCDVCQGRRYNRETLDIKYKDKSIADILDMTSEDAMHFFDKVPNIYEKLKTMCKVGLGYIKIGQSATTLSGGEAQRIKLAKELSKRSTGKTLYILDEPTTGLHFEDISKLLDVLHQLVELGNTVLVIEHNMDVIKTADYIIDVGPEGGNFGGRIVTSGTPEDVVKCSESLTGQYLKTHLK
jgi:excinuclease ABC subunit A